MGESQLLRFFSPRSLMAYPVASVMRQASARQKSAAEPARATVISVMGPGFIGQGSREGALRSKRFELVAAAKRSSATRDLLPGRHASTSLSRQERQRATSSTSSERRRRPFPATSWPMKPSPSTMTGTACCSAALFLGVQTPGA